MKTPAPTTDTPAALDGAVFEDPGHEDATVDALTALFSGGKPAKKPVAADDDDDDADLPEEDDDDEGEEPGDDAPAAEDDDDLTPEEEEDDDEDADDDDEEEEEEGAKDQLKMPERFRARLDKLKNQREEWKAKTTALETEKKALEDRLAEADADPILLQPTAQNPLSNVRNLAELAAAEAHWQKLLDWAEDNEDGGTLAGADGKETELDRVGVRNLRKMARRMVEQHVPARRAYHEQRSRYVAEVKKAYPFLTQPNHKGAQYAARLVKAVPELAAVRPDAELLAGDAYVGALVRKGLAVPVRGKNGEVKLVPVAKAPAAQSKGTEKPPVRRESAGTRVRVAGRSDKSGRVSAALASGDGEAAIMALFDPAA